MGTLTAGDDDNAPSLPDVGPILQRHRRAHGLSLDAAAALSGLSSSFLSAVERGQSDISLRRLARLAQIYDEDVGSLLSSVSRQARPQFLPSDQRTFIDRGEGIEYRRLRLPGIEFELITVSLAPHTAFRDAITHPGIDIVYVPVGEVTLEYDGEDHLMRAGDSGVWSGSYPHRFRNDSASESQFVAVVTQAVWDRR